MANSISLYNFPLNEIDYTEFQIQQTANFNIHFPGATHVHKNPDEVDNVAPCLYYSIDAYSEIVKRKRAFNIRHFNIVSLQKK